MIYYTQNNIGSTTLLTNKEGNDIGQFLYTPFGEMWVEEASEVDISHITRFFTNQQYDKESGLYYYNARYYDPHLGNFLTPDPSMANLNHYAYASANPIKYSDPTGLMDYDPMDSTTWGEDDAEEQQKREETKSKVEEEAKKEAAKAAEEAAKNKVETKQEEKKKEFNFIAPYREDKVKGTKIVDDPVIEFIKKYGASQDFGVKSPYYGKAGDKHFGIDLKTPLGTPLPAFGAGKVIAIETKIKGKDVMQPKGNYIKTVDEFGNIRTYQHLSTVNVQVGDIVVKGQIIGETGNTGNSTGPHLHTDFYSPSFKGLDNVVEMMWGKNNNPTFYKNPK